MNAPYLGAVVLGAALLLSGCQPAPEQAEPVRPVLTKTLTLETAPASQFAGKIAPRYTTNLSFQTFGRVIERSVDVGDFVEPGQQIAQLDTTTQQLAIRTAEANLSSAQAQLNNLLAVQQSQRSLLDLGNISDAVFESAAQASSSGEAAVAQARAQLDKAKEQLGRATLRADTASLVTAVSVQPGQTVTVGQTVATVVRPESREAVIYVAEVEAGNLRVGDQFTIVKQLDPTIQATGAIREIAPQADPSARTVEVRIALNDGIGALKLGSTILATQIETTVDQLVLPISAVVEDANGNYVWVVDPRTAKVARREVEITPRDAGTVRAVAGMEVGDVVVIAGANSLADGQTVRVNEGPAR